MSMHLGAYKLVFFDSARQVEYTPQLAKELASTVLESMQDSLTCQMLLRFRSDSNFHTLLFNAAGKQPSRLLSLPFVLSSPHCGVVQLASGFQFFSCEGSLQQCTLVQVENSKFLCLAEASCSERLKERGV